MFFFLLLMFLVFVGGSITSFTKGDVETGIVLAILALIVLLAILFYYSIRQRHHQYQNSCLPDCLILPVPDCDCAPD